MVQLIPKPPSNDGLSQLDPLACAIAPAKDETPEQRIARLQAEEQAKKLSDDIDKFLKKSAASGDYLDGHRKKAMAVKVLLLGQSECGKSTALKSTSNTQILILDILLLVMIICIINTMFVSQTSRYSTILNHSRRNELHGEWSSSSI
jgi:hypothetical protein